MYIVFCNVILNILLNLLINFENEFISNDVFEFYG